MASIGPVNLAIFENPTGQALVQVSYTLTATHHDVTHEQTYRERAVLIGDDTPAAPGEDGADDIIPGGTIWDGFITFSSSAVAFTQIHERSLPSVALDEDPALFQADELRARVTLTPVPAPNPSRESNLVRRGEPVLDGRVNS